MSTCEPSKVEQVWEKPAQQPSSWYSHRGCHFYLRTRRRGGANTGLHLENVDFLTRGRSDISGRGKKPEFLWFRKFLGVEHGVKWKHLDVK